MAAACCLSRALRGDLTVADALLCHDDELEGRRIAFILYLVPSWDRSFGGTLDLYDTDGKTQLCSSPLVTLSELKKSRFFNTILIDNICTPLRKWQPFVLSSCLSCH